MTADPLSLARHSHGGRVDAPNIDSPYFGDPDFVLTAAIALLLGAIGVIATSVFYALAGPQAALPGGGTDFEAVRQATSASAAYMCAAGVIGMPSDVLLAVGAIMLAATKRGPGAGVAMAGWLAMAAAGGLFIVVDAMVGFVLPVVAAQAGDAAGYFSVRALFDILFDIGTFATGAGALAAAWSPHWIELRSRGLVWAMRVVGLIALLSSVSFVAGLQSHRLMGPGIALFGVTLAVMAGRVIKASMSAAR